MEKAVEICFGSVFVLVPGCRGCLVVLALRFLLENPVSSRKWCHEKKLGPLQTTVQRHPPTHYVPLWALNPINSSNTLRGKGQQTVSGSNPTWSSTHSFWPQVRTSWKVRIRGWNRAIRVLVLRLNLAFIHFRLSCEIVFWKSLCYWCTSIQVRLKRLTAWPGGPGRPRGPVIPLGPWNTHHDRSFSAWRPSDTTWHKITREATRLYKLTQSNKMLVHFCCRCVQLISRRWFHPFFSSVSQLGGKYHNNR